MVRVGGGPSEVLGFPREDREVGEASDPVWARFALNDLGSGPDALERVALGAARDPAAGGVRVGVAAAHECPVCVVPAKF